MGFKVFEEEESVENTQQPTAINKQTLNVLGTRNIQKSSSAPSKLENVATEKVQKGPKVNAPDAAALPPKKQIAQLKKSSIKKTEGMSADEIRRLRRAELLRKQGVLSDTKKPSFSL
ncbi:hypothetical protein E3Q16_04319 [Wallemia mellicola]|nr:hypothetical protein E3Q24_04284 [Wallemia mellicola]TIB98459.1 hypothetical protein E3Q16_04319 [Wallemia mellicola]TIC18537.1 hypothetical protein E3Q13_01956 [Wallemia mellicola]TIC19269.1 hypothetical protein E3Q12_04292 [Wallemia mellicola]TIC37950.1 hypothetical protein E3Q09_00453 [Wallemia mellicola]